MGEKVALNLQSDCLSLVRKLQAKDKPENPVIKTKLLYDMLRINKYLKMKYNFY
jgi:hypothetical protein